MYNFTDALIEDYLIEIKGIIKQPISSLNPDDYKKLMSRFIDDNFIIKDGERYLNPYNRDVLSIVPTRELHGGKFYANDGNLKKIDDLSIYDKNFSFTFCPCEFHKGKPNYKSILTSVINEYDNYCRYCSQDVQQTHMSDYLFSVIKTYLEYNNEILKSCAINNWEILKERQVSDTHFKNDVYIEFTMTDNTVYKIGVEYDGARFHDVEIDQKKDNTCANYGIKLIRLREPAVNDSLKNYIPIYQTNSDYVYLAKLNRRYTGKNIGSDEVFSLFATGLFELTNERINLINGNKLPKEKVNSVIDQVQGSIKSADNIQFVKLDSNDNKLGVVAFNKLVEKIRDIYRAGLDYQDHMPEFDITVKLPNGQEETTKLLADISKEIWSQVDAKSKIDIILRGKIKKILETITEPGTKIIATRVMYEHRGGVHVTVPTVTKYIYRLENKY